VDALYALLPLQLHITENFTLVDNQALESCQALDKSTELQIAFRHQQVLHKQG
jgi:hypothetical protein